LKIPYEPLVFGYHINVHMALEYFAFFIAFRYYIYLRKEVNDSISSLNRLYIILGAVLGALVGSRLVGYLENPLISVSEVGLFNLLNIKTIMGGLFGGLLGVELAKKIIGEKTASGDLFTLPIIVGIFIGRIGCFLSGTNEFTYGKVTNFFMGMDLGDGLKRHPTALYELLFLVVLYGFLRNLKQKNNLQNGLLFKYFMILYFSFRFFLEFLKPNTFFILGLSSIQILCLICLLYYNKTIQKLFKYAR